MVLNIQVINRKEILRSVIYVTSFVMDQTTEVATEFVHIVNTASS